MAVWYLDNDDEITDAVARLRDTDDVHVVLVVPPGSRIATGRINFKLLAREARTRDLTLAVASPDEQVRTMAASAGVLARATPDEAAAALARGEEQAAEPPPAAEDAAVTVAASNRVAGSPGPLSWRSQRLRVTTVAVLAVVLVAGFVLSQTVPTARVTLQPRLIAIGPVHDIVSAAAEVPAIDVEGGVVPAQVLRIPLSVEEAFEASGSTETTAQGEVVFSAADQVFDQEIASGTRVETPAGIEFQTVDTVTLPRGLNGGASSVTARVEAITPGVDGNVEAEAISIVPSLEDQGISVSNPAPTTGGSTTVGSRVTAADYDRAAVELRNLLSGALDAYLRDPANTPAGVTLFAETASLGPLTLDPPADTVVGTDAASFGLTGSVEAQVLGVDESTVDEVARERLLATVPADTELVAGSMRVEHGEGTVDGDRIDFDSTAAASVIPDIDPEELASRIAGLPVSEAQAILEGLGTATVNVWPGFLGDLPNDRQRITLDVLEASDTE
jgi:Baseplate J-like protein